MTLLSGTTEKIISALGGEALTYKPAGGGTRAISAIVDRRDISPLGSAPHGHSQRLEILVVNDATDGIAATEVDTGGDMVTVARRIGEAAQDRPIKKIVNQDSDGVLLEVR